MKTNAQSVSDDLLIQVETLKSELEQEIAKRKQAEKALLESQTRDRLIFRNSAIGILFYDQNGVVTELNPKAEAIYNIKPAAAVGFNLLHKNQQKGVLKGVLDSLSGNPGYYEGKFTDCSSGRVFFKRAHYNPVYSDQNEIVGGICMVEDITQEYMTYEALAENEKKFRLLAENSVDSIFELDLEGFHQYVSPSTTEIFGYTVEETIGSHFSRYLPEAKLEEAYEVFGKVLSGESIRSYESEAIRKDGRTIIAEFSISPISKDGQIIGFQGLTRDVTAQKMAERALAASEARYRLLFESAPVAITLSDYEGNVKDFNPTALKTFGYLETDVQHVKFTDIYAEPMARAQLIQELKQYGIITEKEVRFKKKTGELLYLLVNMRVVEIEDKNYILSMLIDIGHQKQTENALKESHAKLRNLTKYLQTVRESERTIISRELHDELGQVMTAINMEASWVAKKIPDSLNTIKPRMEAISELSVGAIRSVKRIISKLRPTLLSDLGLTAAIKWEAKEYQQRTGICFEVNIAPEEFEVSEDLGITLFRIFQEATTNVIRHAGASIVVVNLMKKNNEVELTVKDNGLGFSGDDILLNESFGILGMRERVEMLDGILEILSKPEKGTTLVSRLPL